MRYRVTVDGQEFPVEMLDEHHARIGERVHELDFVSISGQPVYSLIIDGKSFEAYVYPDEQAWQVLLVGRAYHVTVVDEREARLVRTQAGQGSSEGEFVLRAPMPGLVVSVPIAAGQAVILVILESMKMQNELRAPRAGKVANLRTTPGETVEQKQILLSIA